VPATESTHSPDPHDPEDRALVAAHVAGDPAAFGTLFARHRDRLWAVALRTTGDPEEAADALQDAMVAAFRRADSYRGDAAVTTWLHRVVVNACLDRLRRRKVRAAEPLPEQPEEQADRATAVPRDREDPATAAERSELRRTVRAALDRLPVDQRVALVLVDVEGYSIEEASRLLDAAPGTVKSRCSRGRARLRVLLDEAGVTSGNRPGPLDVPSPASAGRPPRAGGAVPLADPASSTRAPGGDR
jgi:RNA polymerase sigma-70 factor (ECF subfamily)